MPLFLESFLALFSAHARVFVWFLLQILYCSIISLIRITLKNLKNNTNINNYKSIKHLIGTCFV